MTGTCNLSHGYMRRYKCQGHLSRALTELVAAHDLGATLVNEDGTGRPRSTLNNQPASILIGLVACLVFCPGGDKDKVSKGQFVPLQVVIEPFLHNQYAGAGDEVHYGIFVD